MPRSIACILFQCLASCGSSFFLSVRHTKTFHIFHMFVCVCALVPWAGVLFTTHLYLQCAHIYLYANQHFNGHLCAEQGKMPRNSCSSHFSFCSLCVLDCIRPPPQPAYPCSWIAGMNLFRNACFYSFSTFRLHSIEVDGQRRAKKKKNKTRPKNWFWPNRSNAIAQSRTRAHLYALWPYNKRYNVPRVLFTINFHEREPSRSMNIHYTLCFVYNIWIAIMWAGLALMMMPKTTTSTSSTATISEHVRKHSFKVHCCTRRWFALRFLLIPFLLYAAATIDSCHRKYSFVVTMRHHVSIQAWRLRAISIAHSLDIRLYYYWHSHTEAAHAHTAPRRPCKRCIMPREENRFPYAVKRAT